MERGGVTKLTDELEVVGMTGLTSGARAVSAAELAGAAWRKSSRSNTTGGDCVEVAVLGGAVWRKSSRSNSNGGNCVEVAGNVPGVVGVRDSKDPAGPALVFTPRSWQAFLDLAKG